jgi:hypothetical protein
MTFSIHLTDASGHWAIASILRDATAPSGGDDVTTQCADAVTMPPAASLPQALQVASQRCAAASRISYPHSWASMLEPWSTYTHTWETY